MTRHMVLVPVEGPIRLVEADDLRQIYAHLRCTYIESVSVSLVPTWSMVVDEEGLQVGKSVNQRASILYGSLWHHRPILGDVLLAAEGDTLDGRDWVDTDLEKALAVLTLAGAA